MLHDDGYKGQGMVIAVLSTLLLANE
jgi:hypothetical protein